MGQLIVRGLDDRLIQTLKQRAARSGRSAEAEHRAILEQALRSEIEPFAEAGARLRASTPPQATGSAELIRRDRDRDHAGADWVKEVVVDASVAVKWVVDENHSANAALLLQCDSRHAPDHWQAEAINALWSKVFKGDLTAAEAEERMLVLLRAPIVGTPIAPLMPRAFTISVARSVTIYDSLYVALAEQLNVPFVTADEVLIRRMSGDTASAKRMVWIGDVDGR